MCGTDMHVTSIGHEVTEEGQGWDGDGAGVGKGWVKGVGQG